MKAGIDGYLLFLHLAVAAADRDYQKVLPIVRVEMATVVEVAVDMTTCPGVVEAETELAVVGTVDREALK